MKLEHHKQSVASLPRFLFRLLRYALFCLLLTAFSVVIGMMGYHHYAGLTWIDSFHMSCLILTGMGPVAEMKTDAAKLFSAFFALYSGVAFLSMTAVFLAPLVHRLLHILHVETRDKDS
ncbi:MAG TPA: hypothetical protein PLQ93_08115 [Bacteroidia bacterium]|nr:hypothetical protein [Bacteroidia bacterium]